MHNAILERVRLGFGTASVTFGFFHDMCVLILCHHYALQSSGVPPSGSRRDGIYIAKYSDTTVDALTPSVQNQPV
jgi:hypothetical protein